MPDSRNRPRPTSRARRLIAQRLAQADRRLWAESGDPRPVPIDWLHRDTVASSPCRNSRQARARQRRISRELQRRICRAIALLRQLQTPQPTE